MVSRGCNLLITSLRCAILSSSFSPLGRSERPLWMFSSIVLVLILPCIISSSGIACLPDQALKCYQQSIQPSIMWYQYYYPIALVNCLDIMVGLGGNGRVVSRSPRRCPGRG